jgi:uncharacterized protein (TIGR00661 family)
MAKILYGVMGNTNGHIMRTLALVRRMPEHEFHFVGGHRVPAAMRDRYPVLEVPVLRTMHRDQQVDIPATVAQIGRRVCELPSVTARIVELIQSWQPDLAICDREFFLPIACRRAGLPCLSVNHSRLLIACRYPVPSGQRRSWFLATVNDRLLYDYTSHHLIVSFYSLPLRRAGRDEWMPPVLRHEIRDLRPSHGDHVLVYQTSPTFGSLIESLKQLPRPVIVYGFREQRETVGNITFQPYHPQRILEDLAGCAYAVVNGGHNLICEALYLGKPVLCFPIANLFEQFLNAWQVRELGFGDFSIALHPDVALFSAFEQRLETYHRNLSNREFDGTDKVVARIQEFIRQGLPKTS